MCGYHLCLLALASLNFHTNISDSLATNNLENSDGSQGCVGLPPPRLGFVSCSAETLIGLVSQPEKGAQKNAANERASFEPVACGRCGSLRWAVDLVSTGPQIPPSAQSHFRLLNPGHSPRTRGGSSELCTISLNLGTTTRDSHLLTGKLIFRVHRALTSPVLVILKSSEC